MKTNIDLPDSLVNHVKLRTVREGRILKDRADEQAVVTKDPRTGLPLIKCKKAASSQEEMTPQRVAGILLRDQRDYAAEIRLAATAE